MADAPFPGVETRHRNAHYAVLDSGAHVIAWTPPGRNPVLWLSPLASFAPGSAVRGGVPVVFPWFGAGPSGDRTPAHGFARTASWRRASVVNDLAGSGRLEVRHQLTEAGTRSAAFAAELAATFTTQRLVVSLAVTNTGTAPFRYEEALHTYLAVADVATVTVEGMEGCRYLDKVAGVPDELVQTGPVRFDGEVDRVYRHSTDAVVIDPGWGRRLRIGKTGSANTVVWNPGAVKGAALADVGPHWPGFVCVEAGNVRDAAIVLEPGEQHILTQFVEPS